jgi:hypothetical protein
MLDKLNTFWFKLMSWRGIILAAIAAAVSTLQGVHDFVSMLPGNEVTGGAIFTGAFLAVKKLIDSIKGIKFPSLKKPDATVSLLVLAFGLIFALLLHAQPAAADDSYVGTEIGQARWSGLSQYGNQVESSDSVGGVFVGHRILGDESVRWISIEGGLVDLGDVTVSDRKHEHRLSEQMVYGVMRAVLTTPAFGVPDQWWTRVEAGARFGAALVSGSSDNFTNIAGADLGMVFTHATLRATWQYVWNGYLGNPIDVASLAATFTF